MLRKDVYGHVFVHDKKMVEQLTKVAFPPRGDKSANPLPKEVKYSTNLFTYKVK